MGKFEWENGYENPRKFHKMLVHINGVQGAMSDAAEGGARLAEIYKGRDTGNSRIVVTRGRVDRFIWIDDSDSVDGEVHGAPDPIWWRHKVTERLKESRFI